MTSALLIWLHPSGPWRFGPGEGGRDRVDALFRSDRLFSAFTLAFERLGMMEPWLEATARGGKPAVVFSSLFPFQGDTQFIPPPATFWPPPAGAVRVSSPVFAAKCAGGRRGLCPFRLLKTCCLGSAFWPNNGRPMRRAAACCGAIARSQPLPRGYAQLRRRGSTRNRCGDTFSRGR